jgi:hypothetical protein
MIREKLLKNNDKGRSQGVGDSDDDNNDDYNHNRNNDDNNNKNDNNNDDNNNNDNNNDNNYDKFYKKKYFTIDEKKKLFVKAIKKSYDNNQIILKRKELKIQQDIEVFIYVCS